MRNICIGYFFLPRLFYRGFFLDNSHGDPLLFGRTPCLPNLSTTTTHDRALRLFWVPERDAHVIINNNFHANNIRLNNIRIMWDDNTVDTDVEWQASVCVKRRRRLPPDRINSYYPSWVIFSKLIRWRTLRAGSETAYTPSPRSRCSDWTWVMRKSTRR